MTKTPSRSSLSRRVLQAASSFKAMLFRSLFRSSIYESIRPVLSGRMGWLQTLSSLIGRGSEDIHKGGVLRVSAKERAKRSAAREFRRRFVMAEQLELRALMAADLGLDPTMSQQPVAAEVGSMVPGQFAPGPIQPSSRFFSVAAEGTSYLADMNLAAGVEQATQRLSAFAQRGDYTATMQEVFGRTGIDASALRSAVSDLHAQWTSGDLGVRVEILSGQSMSGGLGAYAADYQGSPVIFINGDWLASNPGADAVAKVLIEEFGHSLDRRINAEIDSPGDEGELFANRLVGISTEVSDSQRILNETDAGTLSFGNARVRVEFFNFNTLTFNENGNSLTTTTNAQFLTGGSNQGDYVNGGAPLTIEVDNVKAGDYLTFNSSGIASFPTTFSVDLNRADNVAITRIGTSAIYYSTTRSTNKTTLLFSGATTTAGVSRQDCDALMDVAKFISISQHPSRATNPTIAVSQNNTAVSNPATAAITVSSANDAPVIDTAINPTLTSVSGTVGAPVNGSAVSRSNSTLISSLISGVSDVDELPLFGIAIVGLSSTTNGTLWYTTDDGAAWTRVEPDPVNNPISGTSALLLEDTPATRLYWQPATNAAFTGNVLTFRAWDQSGTTASFNNGTRASVGNAGTPTNALPNNTNPYSVQTDTIAVTVTAVSNSAPVLDASQSPSLSALNEDTAAPANGTNSNSTLVSALVGGITDANGGDPKGIAITAVNTTNGSLRYSLDNGANWSAVGTVSNTSALLLPSNVSNARLQFVPNTDFNGTITDVLTFRAWDQTSGTAGNKVDTSSNGGTTAFSTATDTVTMVVNAVNDAPVASGSPSLTAINEDATSPTGSTVSALFNGNFNDSKDTVTGGSSANTLAGVAITAYTEDAAKGAWQYSSDGTTWTTIFTTTAISNTSALTLLSTDSLRFLPASNFNGAAPTLTVRLLETPRSITTGVRIDASTNGGTTTISSETVVLSHTVNAVNDAPTFTGTISGTYTEAGTALAFLTGASVADVDASNFNGGSVTVSLGAYQTGDVLSINNQGTGAGQIGVSGSNVTFAGATIGTFSGGSASNLVITFNSTNATTAAVQALMGQLRYSSTSNNPTNFGNATTRTATVTLNDGGNTGTGGAQTASVSGTINVSGVNNAPTVTAPASFSVTEDVAGNLVYTGTPFADVDSANLTVTLSVADGAISGALATGITIGGTATERTFAGTVSDLNTYFTTAGNITYTTAANNTTQRTLTTSVSDGVLSNSATSNINITAVNDAPTLTAGGTLAYTENEAAKVIDNTITVNDVDNTTLKGATVTISAGLTSGDLLGFSAQNGITGLYNSTTGVLTLTGTASLANYQTALRSVTYRSTSPDPTGTSATRTISWRVDDGSASSNLSNIATSTINITPILSAPRVDLNGVLDGTDTLVDYTQGSAVLLSSGAEITDDDGGDGMASLVVTLTNRFSGDELTMGSVSGLQSSYTAGVLTITPVDGATTATLALFQQALRTVAFDNTTNSPSLTERVIHVRATDAGSVLGNVAVARVSMTDTNDAPVYQNNLVNQTPSVGLPFSYSLPGSSGVPGSVFVDPENQAMTYQAYVASSTAANATLSPLPGWLTFNSSLMRFYGVAPTNQSLIIRLVATDTEGLSNYGNFTISPKITLNESGTEKFFSYVSFPRVFDLVNGGSYDNAGFYQEETNSFKTASAPLAGSNFIFYQSTFQAGEDPAFFNGNNVAGTLSYLNTSGQVVNIVGVASRPIKTSGNNTRGFYMWVPNRSQAFGTEGAILLVIDANYFANSTVYNSSSDRVDSDLNAYRDQNVVSIASASANESAGTISFVITRTGTSTSGTASVRYTTSIASTDTASLADFTSKSDVATFASGETSKTVTVSLVNDTLYEADETFTVTLSDALNSRLGLAVATGTIIDSDPVPSVSIANAANIEGNKITFTVTRTGNAQAVQTVRYATALSTTAPIASLDDFTSTSGTVTFNPGETTKTFTVQTTQDELLESNETFLVNLSNPTGGLTLGTSQAVGTIKDDESTVFYYVDPPTPTVEGTGIQFVIRRTGTVQNIDFSDANLTDVGQSITYWTSIRSSDNSESADFAGISSGTPASVTFGANARSVTVTIATDPDSLYEGDETFGFFLGNPATLLAGNSTATETNPDGNEVTATILDDDAAPKFSVVVGNPSSVIEGNPISFIITRDADSEQPQSIDYSTVIRASDSTAINDFTATSGTLTFNPGEFGSGSAETVSVTTTLDSVAEGPETFGFSISNPTGGAQLDPTKTEATGTLLDANTAPTASNTTVGTVTKPALEDIPYVFGEFDFGYTDAENAPLWSIQIKTLPPAGPTVNGVLTGVLQKATTSTPDGNGGTTLGGWTPVAVDDVLTISGPLGIGAGALRYVPPSNANNQNLPSAPTFSVLVNDGVNFSSDSPTTNRGTVTINITPVNDAPAGADFSPAQSAYVGGFITFTESQFIMTDSNDVPNANNFLGVVFTDVPERPNLFLPTPISNEGALQVQVGENSTSRTGNIPNARDIRTSAFSQSTSDPVTINGVTGKPQFVTAESGSWTFSTVTYDKRLMGRYGAIYLNSSTGDYYFDQYTDGSGGFSYIARYTGSSAPYTPVYEPLSIPAGSMVSDGFLFDVGANGTTDFFRRTLTFTLTGTALGSFNFQSSLWKTVVDGEFVPKATITSQKLRYSPCFCGVARYNTDGTFQLATTQGTFTTIKFQVQDDGGTANGGVDLDPTPNDLPITLVDGFSPVVNVPGEQYFNEDTTLSFNGDGQSNALYVTYAPPSGPINDLVVVVELDSQSRPGTLSLDGSWPSGVTATNDGSKTIKYQIEGNTAFVNSVLASLNFTPDLDQFSTTDLGAQANPRYPGLNGIGGTDTYAILKVSARNKPESGQMQYPTTLANVDMSVLNVNDAPVVTSGSTTSPAVLEGATDPIGTSVSTLFNSTFSDAIDSSPNNNYTTNQTLAGIAIRDYSPDATKGAWEYSETGASWTAVPGRTNDDLTAFALPASYQLRFVPFGDYNGAAPTLTVRLIESSSTSVSVGSLDVSSNGGTTRFSSGTVVLSAFVTAVNDIPVSVGATPAAVSVLEDSANATAQSLGLSGLDYTPGVPANESTQSLSYIIRTIPSFIELYKADGTTQVNANDVLTLTELRGLKYKTLADVAGAGTLTWDVKDDGGTANGGVDTLPQSLSITVTGVNDAPIFTGTTASISINEDAANSTAISAGLGSLNYGPGGGSDEASQSLTVTISTIPGLVTLFKSDGTTAVTAGTTLTVAELQGLTVRTFANRNGSGTITYTVTDNGGTANGGSDTLSQSISVTVTAVNDAPVASGTASLAAITEDTSNPVGALVSSLFVSNFSDAVDNQTANGGSNNINTLAGIAITNYTRASSKGDWQYSSDNGTSWTTISSSISSDTTSMTLLSTDMLRFLPKTDFNGPAPTLTVRLLETPRSITSGATVDVSTNGGSTTISSGTVVLSHSVTARNDAPVASGSSTLVAINEDTANPPGSTISGLFTANYSDSKDQVIGGSNANNFLGIAVQVHTIDAARGTWEYTSGADWTAPTPLPTVSGNNSILLRSTDRIRFVPAANYNGPATPLVVRLLDNSNATTNAKTAGAIVDTATNGDTTEISSGLVTLTHIVNPVNDPPITTNNTIFILEDQIRPLTTVDFGNYSDVENQPFSAIRIVTPPNKGTLQYNIAGVWTTVNTGDFSISDASIKFRYIPAQNENGNNYTTIEYRVSDGVDFSVSTYTVTINVTPVNDPPISTNDSVTSNEDAVYYFNVTDFGTYTDIENDPLTKVQITTLPSLGTLEYNNGTSWVSALNAEITPNLLTGSSATSRLRYTPPANAFGSPFTGFGFKVSDGTDYSLSSYTVTINIAPVNDAPVASGSASLASVFKNDTSPPWATVSSLFSGNFSDPLDTGNTTDSFYGVAVRGLTQDASKGTWEYKIGSTIGVVPNSSDATAFVLRVADSLRFVPFADVNTPYVGIATPLSVRLIETKSSDEADATGASDASGSTVNVSTNGGTTVYSAATVDLNHEVKGTLLVKAFNDVSEGSDAIFRVSLDSNNNVGGTSVTLGLTPGTASSSTDYGPGYREAYYYDNSSNKQTLPISENVLTLPQNVTVFYVSVPTTDDNPTARVYEGPETFSLSASITVEGTPITNSDVATIRDDGNGKVFNEDGTVNNSATPDNDLSVAVTGYGPVNEGSTYAMFKVDATSGDGLNFVVVNGTATLVTPTIEFSLNGTTWTVFNASDNNAFPTVPSGTGNIGTVYVRVTITSESDSMYEGSERFLLRATSRANSSVTATAHTDIVDDGTGLKYTGNFTGDPTKVPATDGTNLDNDLSIDVTSYSPVNEGSTWAMFKVVAAAGDTIDLAVSNVSTTGLSGAVVEFSYSGTSTSWTTYGSSSKPVVPGSVGTGSFFVRVNITAEQETALDTGEVFTLTATSNGPGAKSNSADTTIVDNGSGTIFTGNFGNDLPQFSNNFRDDDRVIAVRDKVFSRTAAGVVLTDVRANDTTRNGATISSAIGLNPQSSTVSSTYTNSEGTWTVLSGGEVRFAPVASQKTDPTAIEYAISADNGSNYSLNKALLFVDYGVGVVPDSVNSIPPTQEFVSVDVLLNDTLADTYDSDTLKLVDTSNSNALVDTLTVAQGTWRVVAGTGAAAGRKVLEFQANMTGPGGVKNFAGNPSPVSYAVKDRVTEEGYRGGNLSSFATATISYLVTNSNPFFIRINDRNNDSTPGTLPWDVIVVDNVLAAGVSVNLYDENGILSQTIVTTAADASNTVGQIFYQGSTTNFSTVKVDAKSKPVTVGSVANINLSTTTQSRSAATIEIQAFDSQFIAQSTSSTNVLVSPMSGTKSTGSALAFRESLGRNNQLFPASSTLGSSDGNVIENYQTVASNLRTVSVSRSSGQFSMTAGQSTSLMKSLVTTNSAASQIVSLNIGGKVLESDPDGLGLAEVNRWFFSVGMSKSLAEARTLERSSAWTTAVLMPSSEGKNDQGSQKRFEDLESFAITLGSFNGVREMSADEAIMVSNAFDVLGFEEASGSKKSQRVNSVPGKLAKGKKVELSNDL